MLSARLAPSFYWEKKYIVPCASAVMLFRSSSNWRKITRAEAGSLEHVRGRGRKRQKKKENEKQTEGEKDENKGIKREKEGKG